MSTDTSTIFDHSNNTNKLQCPKCGSKIVHHVINQNDGKLVMCINSECPYPFLENLDIMFYYIPGKQPGSDPLTGRSDDRPLRKRPKRSVSQPMPFKSKPFDSSHEHKRSRTIDLFEVQLPDINSIEPLELPSPLIPIEISNNIVSPPPSIDLQIDPEILDSLLKEFDSIPKQPTTPMQPTKDSAIPELCKNDIITNNNDPLLSFLSTNSSMDFDFLDKSCKTNSFEEEILNFSIGEEFNYLMDIPYQSISPINL